MSIIDFLKGIGRSKDNPPVAVSSLQSTEFTKEQEDLISRCGANINDIQKLLQQQSEVAYDRYNLAQLYTTCIADPIMSGALGVYAETAVSVSPVKGRSMWVSSKDTEVDKELNLLLDSINLEERLYDWAQTIAQYGDLFIRCMGEPGVGLIGVDDTIHPIEIGRIDVFGNLVGFFITPNAFLKKESSMTNFKTKLLPPWDFVHFRNIAGMKRRLPMDANTSSYSTNFAMGGPTIEGSATYGSRYGTSILFDALLPYKRYRLAQDSLMLCRLSKGPLRYIFKIAVPDKSSNPAMVASLIDEIKRILSRSTTLDTRSASASFTDRKDPPSSFQDILIPVFGQANNLIIDKIGGEADIRWIEDINDLRAQLATALRVPLPLLAGFSDTAPSGDWSGKGLENIDIRFARSVRRLQKTLIQGVTRLCQIHLAWLGKDPDPKKFEVAMNITSSAEEKQMQDASNSGADTIDKIMKVITDSLGEDVDKAGLLNYFNKTFLKLEDLDISKYILKPPIVRTSNSVEVDFGSGKGAKPQSSDQEGIEPTAEPVKDAEIPLEPDVELPKESRIGSDNRAALPVDMVPISVTINEKSDTGKDIQKIVSKNIRTNENWYTKFKDSVIEVKRES